MNQHAHQKLTNKKDIQDIVRTRLVVSNGICRIFDIDHTGTTSHDNFQNRDLCESATRNLVTLRIY